MEIPQAPQIAGGAQITQVQDQPSNQPQLVGQDKNPIQPSQPAQPIKPLTVQVGANKFLSKDQVAQIVKNRPSNVMPDQIVKGLVSRGYTLQGFNDTTQNPFNSQSGTSGTTDATTQQPEKKSVLGFVGNVFKSGAGVIGGLFSAVMHPIQTIKNVANIGLGLAETPIALATGQKIDNPTYENFINMLGDRYGSIDKFKETLYNDPVGVVLDASIAFDGAESLLGKASDLAKAGEMTKTADILAQARDAIKATGELPKKLASPVISKVGEKAGELAKSTLGAATGVGKETINAAIDATKAGGAPAEAFTKALRGSTTADDVVKKATDVFSQIKEQRGAAYQAGLQALKDSKVEVDISPVFKTLQQNLDKYGIKMSLDNAGQPALDFSRSTLSTADEQSVVKNLVDDIHNWGEKEGDLSPIGVDTLKRRIDNLYSPNKDVRGMVTSLRGAVKTALVKSVPEYDAMTKAYTEASQTLDDLKGLSLGGGANNDTIFKKLTSTLKDNQEYRKSLLDTLQAGADEKTLSAMISGLNLSPKLARGLIGRGAEAFGALKVLAQPSILIPLAATSPRVVGEFIKAFGASPMQVSIFQNLVKAVKAGRVSQVSQESASGSGQ